MQEDENKQEEEKEEDAEDDGKKQEEDATSEEEQEGGIEEEEEVNTEEKEVDSLRKRKWGFFDRLRTLIPAQGNNIYPKTPALPPLLCQNIDFLCFPRQVWEM